MSKRLSFFFFAGLFALAFFNLYCHSSSDENPVYLNHSDTVRYLGKQACSGCHLNIYNSFMETGMGKSFSAATRGKSTADFKTNHVVYDSALDLSYYPHWISDSLYITEFRIQKKDTVFKRTERVDYIIGSGQHTHSHLTSQNGFIYQLPLTWYAQKKRWDLPPGFENGRNVRFSRAIEFECMSCHNAMPEIVEGSLNKFVKVPDGIDCERCHGPGEVHVNNQIHGIRVDTATEIDYSIVNPRKLSWERQIDVCQRCHLQGNSVLKPGKKFSDFKPGMKLSNFLEVYMPRYEGREDEFIMASHAQRLQQSKCFIASNKEIKKEPGKSFGSLNLTCVSCHNPHVSVTQTGKQIFNNACMKCHKPDACLENSIVIQAAGNNCVSCHMPKSGSSDIPHVSVHDHKIKIPVHTQKLNDIKRFAGIYCVNQKTLNEESKSRAYLNYFEKFEGEPISLDSANYYLQKSKGQSDEIKIHYFYLRNDWSRIVDFSKTIKEESIQDAWSYYRIGQAYQNLGDFQGSEKAYQQAVAKATDNLEFINKLAVVNIQLQQYPKAIELFKSSLKKQPKQADAWVNMGFAFLNLKQLKEAMNCYNQALLLDPDNSQALLNRAALHHLNKNKKSALLDLKHILQREPKQEQVKSLLKQMQSE